MTDDVAALQPLDDAGLLRFIDEVIDREVDDPHFDDVIAQLPALHDQLRPTQRNYIAEHLLGRLGKRLSKIEPFDNVAVNILTLADPFFARSDYIAEAQLSIGTAFSPNHWDNREFGDLVSLGSALAGLGYNPPGAASLWEKFYERFSVDDDKSVDAFDVALAGLAILGVDAFARLADREPDRQLAADRWQIWLSVLIRESGHSAVQTALSNFLETIPARERRQLQQLANAKSLRIESATLRVVEADTPKELQLAHAIFEAESRYFEDRTLTGTLTKDKVINVVHSDYAENVVLHEFQLSVRDAVRALYKPALVNFQKSRAFAELPPDGTLQQRFIYAFPTYLTSNKSRAGYAVFPFGRQRRLGAVFYRTSSLLMPPDKRTLAELLREVKQNSGSTLYTLRNFAMAEMVHEELRRNPDIMEKFDLDSIQALSPPDRGYIPMEVFASNETSSVFLFDLSGLSRVHAQVSHATKGPQKKFHGAQIVVLEHGLETPVGIGLNRYASEWALEGERWRALQSLAREWSERQDFREAMRDLGVDIDDPPIAAGSHVQKRAVSGNR